MYSSFSKPCKILLSKIYFQISNHSCCQIVNIRGSPILLKTLYRSTNRVGDTSLFPASYRSLKEIWLLDIAHLQLPMHACLLILAICQLNIPYRQSNSINIGNFLYNLSKIDTYITLSTMFTVMSFHVDLFSLSVHAGIVTRHNRKEEIWQR